MIFIFLENINKVSGYGYVSALAGLSDHVPVVATITHELTSHKNVTVKSYEIHPSTKTFVFNSVDP